MRRRASPASRILRLAGYLAVWATSLGIVSSSARADIAFSVIFDDPQGLYQAYHEAIAASLRAAGAEWARHIASSQDVTIDAVIAFDHIPTARGGAMTSALVDSSGPYTTWEMGTVAEIRTGQDPNGPERDLIITLGVDYLKNELWFDPNPFLGNPVPAQSIDAFTVMLHEIGHGLTFNGWRDWVTGALPGDYQSTFDRWIFFSGDNPFFHGPAAMAAYGGPVPLTYGNLLHVGNNPPRPGNDLLDDLMNGVVSYRGRRTWISALDLAISIDAGLPVRSVALLPADANKDGHVNLADFSVLKQYFGELGGFSKGDFDGSGRVDLNDFSILKRYFGQSTAAAVPEPSSSLLGALAACWCLACGGRRWQSRRRFAPRVLRHKSASWRT